jgi:phosphate transport system substrate-binding protein
LHTCAVSLPGIALIVDVVPESAQDFTTSDLVLWWGNKPEEVRFAFQIAEDELVVIINVDNPNTALSTKELVGLFNGRINHWTDISIFAEKLAVWIYPEGSHLSGIFNSGVLSDQGYSRLANLAPSPGPMLEEVSTDPGAIGFVSRAWLLPKVSQSEIDPDLQIALRRPILALVNSEPQSGVRDLLACLQTGEGQKVLKAIYSRTPE